MIHQQFSPTKDNPGGGIIVYNQEDFIGLVPGYFSTVYLRKGKGAAYQVDINPYREIGILQPGYLPSNVTKEDGTGTETNIAAIINNGFMEKVYSTGNPWLIEAGVKIHKLLSNAGIFNHLSLTAPFPYSIGTGTGAHAHSAFVGEDIIEFTIGGVPYMLYSYNDNTDGDIGRVDPNPETFDATADFIDNWFSTATGGGVLNKNYSHPMIEGDSGYLYIADGNKLWFIASDGSIGSNSTIVPSGFKIKCFTKTGTHLVIFADRIKGSSVAVFTRGDSYAYFWNYSATRADYVFSLNDNEVTAAFNFNGVVGCFTTGRSAEDAGYNSKISKLQIFSGGKFESVFNFTGSSPGYGGVDFDHNKVWWNSEGRIFTYGAHFSELFNPSVNHIASAGGSGSGFLKAFNGTDVHVSSGSGASAGCQIIGPQLANSFSSNAQWRGMVVEPIFPIGMKGQVEQVEVNFFDSSSGGRAITLQLEIDYANVTSTILSTLATTTAGKNIVYKKLNSSGATLPQFNNLLAKCNWSDPGGGAGTTSAPKINYIKIYYSFIPIVI